jgi:thioredoxin 1
MTIIHFTAEWCNPCKKIKPIIDSFLENRSDINYILVDVDAHIEKAREYSVLSVPTLLFVKENMVVSHRHVGLITNEQLIEYTS